MGIFSALRPNKNVDSYAAIAIPGEATIDVKGGRLRLTYAVSEKAAIRSVGDDDEIQFDAPMTLEVTLTDPSGETRRITGMDIRRSRTTKTRGGFGTRQIFEKIKDASPGEYTIKVTAAEADLAGERDPQLLVGS